MPLSLSQYKIAVKRIEEDEEDEDDGSGSESDRGRGKKQPAKKDSKAKGGRKGRDSSEEESESEEDRGKGKKGGGKAQGSSKGGKGARCAVVALLDALLPRCAFSRSGVAAVSTASPFVLSASRRRPSFRPCRKAGNAKGKRRDSDDDDDDGSSADGRKVKVDVKGKDKGKAPAGKGRDRRHSTSEEESEEEDARGVRALTSERKLRQYCRALLPKESARVLPSGPHHRPSH